MKTGFLLAPFAPGENVFISRDQRMHSGIGFDQGNDLEMFDSFRRSDIKDTEQATGLSGSILRGQPDRLPVIACRVSFFDEMG
jgi:hypothetical protein